MDWKLELVALPVTDVDRAKAFYVGLGFVADVDVRPADGVRVVQLTPPGSACSIGLGTGLGSALILDGVVHAAELGDLRYRKGRTYGQYLGKPGLKRIGLAKWSHHVISTVKAFKKALQVDYVVLGGGQAKLVKRLPAGVLPGDNSKAFVGGERAWSSQSGVNFRYATG